MKKLVFILAFVLCSSSAFSQKALVGAFNGTTAQFAASTTPTQAVARRAQRFNVTLRNLDAAITIYYGYSASVSSSTGFPLKAGESQPLYTQAAIFIVSASGTPTVAIEEEYD